MVAYSVEWAISMVFEVFSNWMRGNRTESNSKVKIPPVKIIVDYWWQIPNGCLLLQGPTFCQLKSFEHWCLYRIKLICKCFECQSHLFCPALKDTALYGNIIHFCLLFSEMKLASSAEFCCFCDRYKSADCFVWKATALKMKELVSTTAVSIRHARAKICITVLIGSHTLTSLHTCNIQDLWRVWILIFLLSWWGSNSCMLMSFQFFAFQFASGPISQNWSLFSH